MQVQMNAPLQPTEGRGGSTRWYCQCRIPLEVLGDGPKLCRDSRFCRFEPAGQAAKKNNGRNLPFEWRDQGTDSGTNINPSKGERSSLPPCRPTLLSLSLSLYLLASWACISSLTKKQLNKNKSNE